MSLTAGWSSQLRVDDVQHAADRIRGHVRRTPMLAADASPAPTKWRSLSLKLEVHQLTGSFKVRGAFNSLLSYTPEQMARGIVTASGGNHGLAIAYAARECHVKATIFLPRTARPGKAARMRAMGAEVIERGDVWDDAHEQAGRFVTERGGMYVHPFADPLVIAGQGTIALEVLEDRPDIQTLVVAVGGGGLISGIAMAAKALRPDVTVIGVEPTGAATLSAGVAAGAVVDVPISTRATTLANRRADQEVLRMVTRYVDGIVLVTDKEMQEAAEMLWNDYAVGTELAGAATFAALLYGRVAVASSGSTCAIICGAGSDGFAS